MLIRQDALLRKNIFTIAGPAMIEMIMYMLIGVVDIAVVGRLGAAPLAAVSLGAEIFFALVLFLEALAVGATILVAQAKGARDDARIRSYIAHTLVMAVFLGIIALLLGLHFTENVLAAFAVEADVYAQARDYLLITFRIAPFALLFYMINSVFRGLGRTDIPMTIAIIVNIVNVAGDFLLVYGLAGFPQMGVPGAAVATAVAHLVGCALALAALFGNRSGFRPYWRDFCQLRLKRFKAILALGIPTLTEQFFNISSGLVSVFLIVSLGTVAFATHQVAITIESISFMPGFGLAIAATAMVGQAIGAGDARAARRAARGCLEFSMLIMGSFALLFALIPGWIAAVFTNDPQIIELAEIIIRVAALEQLTIAFSMVAGGILRGSGDTRTPMLISIAFTWLYRLPLLYLLIKVWAAPLIYIWLLFVSDWLLRTLVYYVIYTRQNWLRRALAVDRIGH